MESLGLRFTPSSHVFLLPAPSHICSRFLGLWPEQCSRERRSSGLLFRICVVSVVASSIYWAPGVGQALCIYDLI